MSRVMHFLVRMINHEANLLGAVSLLQADFSGSVCMKRRLSNSVNLELRKERPTFPGSAATNYIGHLSKDLVLCGIELDREKTGFRSDPVTYDCLPFQRPHPLPGDTYYTLY